MRARTAREGESMTAFVLCLPLLITVFLSACDLWTLVAAQTRTQGVADAGCRYAVARATAGSALSGTLEGSTAGSVHVPSSDIAQAALRNGYLNGQSGEVLGVDVEASASRDGEASVVVRTYQDGAAIAERRERRIPLCTISVRASQRVNILSWPLRELLGGSVVVSRVSQEQVAREVVI